MKTIVKEIKVYSYDELSERAKDKAYFNWIKEYGGDNYFIDEIRDTIKAFKDLFNLGNGRNKEIFDYNLNSNPLIEGLTGLRLRTWILNNFGKDLYKPKYLKSFGKTFKNWPKGFIFKQKFNHKKEVYTMVYSKIFTENSCVLTESGYDFLILKPIYDFIKNPQKETDFEDLIKSCMEEIESIYRKELEYYSSKEYFEEMCKDSGWEFLENGEAHFG